MDGAINTTTSSQKPVSNGARTGKRVDGRRRPDPQTTRQRILTAAVEHIISDNSAGDERRTEGLINSVVRRSGLTKGALYHHFDGQAALLSAVVQQHLAPQVYASWINPIAASRSRWKCLREIFDNMTARPDEYLPAFTLAALLSSRLNRPAESESPEKNAPDEQAQPLTAAAALDELFASWVQSVSSAIAEGLPPEKGSSAAVLALAMLSAFTGAALAARTAASSEVFAEAAKALTQLLVSQQA